MFLFPKKQGSNEIYGFFFDLLANLVEHKSFLPLLLKLPNQTVKKFRKT